MRPIRRHSAETNGAALIMVIGILTFLLVISASFFQMSREEMRTSTNYSNQIRTELLTDGAFAIAEAFLQHDLAVHPTATSLDHAWRTYFNGSWAVGKPWLWAPDKNDFRLPILEGGIPLYQLSDPNDSDGLFKRISDGLYIPRVDDGFNNDGIPLYSEDNNYDTNRYAERNQNVTLPDGETFASHFPFVTSNDFGLSPLTWPIYPAVNPPDNLTDRVATDYEQPGNGVLAFNELRDDERNARYPFEQIHFWTDVDNDGDGLNDSIWIPIASDLFYPDDGLDNDLDGLIDAEDLDGEPGIFLYNGLNDGIDNDNDGLVDETKLQDDTEGGDGFSENRYVFLTLPPERMFYVYNVKTGDFDPVGEVFNQPITLSDMRSLLSGAGVPPDAIMAVDNRDNDHNSVADDGIDATHFMLRDDGEPFARDAYPEIFALLEASRTFDPFNRIAKIYGEPMSEIVGRVAILINDESSKANVNVGGGLSFTRGNLADTDEPLGRAFGQGAGPEEYELSVLPNVAVIRADRTWTLRMGANDGGERAFRSDIDPSESPNNFETFDTNDVSFAENSDKTFPGFGFVDDNGNAAWLAFNGIDDDGDSILYQHDGIDNDLNGFTDEAGEGELVGVDEGTIPYDYNGDGFREYAALEGIDEPGEFQQFRPFRNMIAESDTFDNDDDDIRDEIGELGDRYYRTHKQLELVSSVGPITFDRMRRLVTTHSTDRNDRHMHRGNSLAWNTTHLRTTSGSKLDYNFSGAQQIADALRSDWDYPESVPNIRRSNEPNSVDSRSFDDDALTFARGLRQEDTSVVFVHDGTGIALSLLGEEIATGWTTELLADADLRADQLAVNIKDFADTDFARTELTRATDDPWWRELTDPFINNIDPFVATRAQAAQYQQITYTSTGIEAIRINEIMVRPVRRLEVEGATVFDPDDDLPLELDPNLFSPVATPDFQYSVATTFDALEFLTFPTPEIPDPATDPWVLTVPLPPFPGLSDMGIASAYRTQLIYGSYQPGGHTIATTIPGVNPGTEMEVDVPDIIQFSFASSPQLPPGRYYLTVNCNIVTNSGEILSTIDDPADFSFQHKIGQALESPLGDIIAALGDPLTVRENLEFLEQRFRAPAVIGLDGLGRLTGDAFMQASTIYTPRGRPNLPNIGWTVLVPDFEENEEMLHVAIRSHKSADPAGAPEDNFFAINYFEFSQEPDHEWVEVVNLSDDLVNMSGWQLVVEGERRTEMTIPQNTRIAPHGMLLLGTNKFDYFDDERPDEENPIIPLTPLEIEWYSRGPFFENGIGLAKGLLRSWPPDTFNSPDDRTFMHVTAPPIFSSVQDEQILNEYERFSVFDVSFPEDDGAHVRDLTDNDGDGVRDADSTHRDDEFQSTLHPDFLRFRRTGSVLNHNRFPEKAWDRIVELEIPDMLDRTSAALVGELVLRGGIFPNYPEHDGIDNDNDNAILTRDGIDNDGDSFGSASSDFVDEDNEGIDEGRFLRDMLNPVGLGIVDSARPAKLPVPGAYNRHAMRFSTIFPGVDFGPRRQHLSYTDVPEIRPFYLDNEDEPPRWKELIERRTFPGDNVIITLYEGHAGRGRVVDRITYSERDVVNRAIDDIIDLRFVLDLEGNPVFDPDGDPVRKSLDWSVDFADNEIIRYSTFWPENTMGIDFYRSLERKHPLYAGDRFGTQNRFQATDGNYDDWSDSTGRWERTVDSGALNILTDNGATIGLLDRHDINNQTLASAAATQEVYEKFSHAFHGSPLRMNAAQRIAENPRIIEDHVEDVETSQFNDLPELISFSAVIEHRQWPFTRAELRNRHIVSPGDLMSLPHLLREDFVYNDGQFGTVDPFLLDFSSVNQSYTDSDLGQTVTNQYSDLSYLQVFLGQTFYDDEKVAAADRLGLHRDLAAVIGNGAANDPLILSVAKARVIQMRPDPPFTLGANNLVWNRSKFEPTKLDDSTVRPPESWAPVILFPLQQNESWLDPPLPEHPDYERFTNLFLKPPTMPNTVGLDRWPIQERVVMYASANKQNFQSSTPTDFVRDGSIALFVWDADDGIPNGEYDIFVGVAEDLSPLLERELANEPYIDSDGNGKVDLVAASLDPNIAAVDLLDPFGVSFINTTTNSNDAQRVPLGEYAVDIEIFTDLDGDRRVWNNAFQPDLPFANANTTQNLNRFESLDQIRGVTPRPDGFIEYGTVRIANNFLAVMLRNRAHFGVPMRFSRVVLVPRGKTPGRINLNTAQSHAVHVTNDRNDDKRIFNPLVGLPGILPGYQPNTTVYGSRTKQFRSDPLDPAPAKLGDGVGSIDDDYVKYLNDIVRGNIQAGDPDNFPSTGVNHTAVLYRAAKIAENLPEHPDGRYYEHISDLVKPAFVTFEDLDRMFYPKTLSELPHDLNDPDGPNPRDLRFDESFQRFRRIANLVTTRSDVFEIIVTVQSGFGRDTNGDGLINYRSDFEFVTTAERKARQVYER